MCFAPAMSTRLLGCALNVSPCALAPLCQIMRACARCYLTRKKEALGMKWDTRAGGVMHERGCGCGMRYLLDPKP